VFVIIEAVLIILVCHCTILPMILLTPMTVLWH